MRRSFIAVVSVLLSATAYATVVIPIEFRELVSAAPVIVHGRVVNLQPQWVDGRRFVETLVTIEAEEYLKGDLGSEVTFTVPGGEIGRVRTVMVGAPTFRVGDELVLFLKTDGAAVPVIFGLSQGVFRVVADRESGQRLVLPTVLMASGPTPVTVVRGDPARRPMEVGKFSDSIRQLVNSQGGVR
jgi:hypothetical protein